MNLDTVVTHIAEAQAENLGVHESYRTQVEDLLIKGSTGELDTEEYNLTLDAIRKNTNPKIVAMVTELMKLWNRFYELTGYVPKDFYYADPDTGIINRDTFPLAFDPITLDYGWPNSLHAFLIEQIRFSDPYEAEIQYELHKVANS